MERADGLLETLSKQGFKLTGPRRLIVNQIVAFRHPFTADEMYDSLKCRQVGRATVFRTLKILQDLELLVRVHLEEGCQHYQLAADLQSGGHHHDRIVCRYCGEIDYLDECPMKDNVQEIASRSGYRVEGHHLDLYGVCPRCTGKH